MIPYPTAPRISRILIFCRCFCFCSIFCYGTDCVRVFIIKKHFDQICIIQYIMSNPSASTNTPSNDQTKEQEGTKNEEGPNPGNTNNATNADKKEKQDKQDKQDIGAIIELVKNTPFGKYVWSVLFNAPVIGFSLAGVLIGLYVSISFIVDSVMLNE